MHLPVHSTTAKWVSMNKLSSIEPYLNKTFLAPVAFNEKVTVAHGSRMFVTSGTSIIVCLRFG
ncbi:hypothetical protein GCM10008090_34830 [Arenicella chitinivorans]|uniref:Uncharacterized protein n=1 Tax=Arenicella chitinivorans TaxID=1329800 RepID=A0A918VRF0_9GAMM|nr:hypothetical protein GCM10008090_34830 [Arenicella chitinivorans]